MSMRAIQWAVEQETASCIEKSVLLMLAFRFNEKRGCAFPGIRRIANDLCCSSRSVIRALGELEDVGLIVIKNRPGSGAGRQSNLYTFPDYKEVEATCQPVTLPEGGKVTISPGQSDSQSPINESRTVNRNERHRMRASRRAPKDFRIDDELKKWLRNNHIDLHLAQSELEKFLDYEFGRAYSDWPATFRNWIRRAVERQSTKADAPATDTTTDLALKLGLTRRPDESDQQWKSRICDASVIADYGYADREIQH